MENIVQKINKFFFKMMKLNEKKVNDRNRLMYGWNHPDCKHVAIAQDRKNEKNKVVVPLRNRDFN